MPARVLVTAGAGGIGLEIVRAFHATGAQVYTCDLDARALAAAAETLPGLHTSVCDIGDRAAIETMVADAAQKLGGIDVLVNNAGIGGPTQPVAQLDPEDWDRVLRVDLTGPFLVCRAAIPHLLRGGQGGAIINMSSAAGRFGYPNRSPYAAAKWGLIGFTKTLSMELGEQGIRVNAIAPGAVDGQRIRQVFEGRAQAAGQSFDEIAQLAMTNQSIKRLVDPRDIAALAVFLASDAAKSISGQVIPIDGDIQRN
jgi:NAD(P)-dependent dehydrogenase (short-subunit alcohol dehydrogenase family)